MQNLHDPLSQTQTTSTGVGDVKTVSPPTGANACEISVESVNIRVTFDGSTPSATNGHVIIKDQNPVYFPVGDTVKFVSATAGSSVLNLTWLG